MTTATNLIVEAVSKQDVKTRYGMKPTFSFKANGAWYKTGFKDPAVVVGMEVSFNYNVTQYGNEIVDSSLVRGEIVVTIPVSTSGVVNTVAVPAYDPPQTRGRGVFPIPVADASRAINRQNALTNARESVVAAHGNKPFALDDTFAVLVIGLARKFEAYTCGDLDLANASQAISKEATPTNG